MTTIPDTEAKQIRPKNLVAIGEHEQYVDMIGGFSPRVDFSEIEEGFAIQFDPECSGEKDYPMGNSFVRIYETDNQVTPQSQPKQKKRVFVSWMSGWPKEVMPSSPFSYVSHFRQEDPNTSLYQEISRHREYDALGDEYAQKLLWDVSGATFVPSDDVTAFAHDYKGLRAVVRTALAGWATVGPEGLLVTNRGRRRAKRLFNDR